jgi:hypothetical protein
MHSAHSMVMQNYFFFPIDLSVLRALSHYDQDSHPIFRIHLEYINNRNSGTYGIN